MGEAAENVRVQSQSPVLIAHEQVDIKPGSRKPDNVARGNPESHRTVSPISAPMKITAGRNMYLDEIAKPALTAINMGDPLVPIVKFLVDAGSS
jgi:hypothetical protein